MERHQGSVFLRPHLRDVHEVHRGSNARLGLRDLLIQPNLVLVSRTSRLRELDPDFRLTRIDARRHCLQAVRVARGDTHLVAVGDEIVLRRTGTKEHLVYSGAVEESAFEDELRVADVGEGREVLPLDELRRWHRESVVTTPAIVGAVIHELQPEDGPGMCRVTPSVSDLEMQRDVIR